MAITTLYDYYKSKGQSLPSVQERAKTFEQLGLGKTGDYKGTLDQNVSLLGRLQSAPVTPPPAPAPATAPASNPAPGTSLAPSSTVNLYGADVPTRTSLLDEYRKKLGLDTLETDITNSLANAPKKADVYNKEMATVQPEKQQLSSLDDRLASMKNSIDQSEADIRKRITDSGGIVTESQVQRLVASEKKPLIDEYNNLLDQRTRLAGNVSADEAAAEKRAGMAYEDATAPITALQTKYKTLGDVFSQLYGAAEKDLGTQIDAAKSAAEKRKADVITTQTDENGNVSVVTREANGSFKVNRVGNIGKPVKTSSSSGAGNTSPAANGIVTSQVRQVSGKPFINLSDFPDAASKKQALNYGAANGITVLNPSEGEKMVSIQNAYTNIQKMKDSVQGLLSKEGGGLNILKGLENTASGALGNEGIRAFNAWRTAVINNVQALAGGQGSGLRINQAEIDTALKNDLPIVTGWQADTVGSAGAKLQRLSDQLDSWVNTIMSKGSANQNQSAGGQSADVNAMRSKYGY